MPTLKITSFSLDPSIGSTQTAVTVHYTYEIAFTKAEVQAIGSTYLCQLLTDNPGGTTGEVKYGTGEVFLSGGPSGWQLIPGQAVLQVWGDDPGDRDPNWYADDDDLILDAQDQHPVVIKDGSQTIPRQFATTAPKLNEDSSSNDELYVLLKVTFPGGVLEEVSAMVTAQYEG